MIQPLLLAAGRSSRMGRLKVLLPWVGEKPILAHVLEQIARVPGVMLPPLLVLGHAADDIQNTVDVSAAQVVFNREYAAGEMLSSFKTGLRAVSPHAAGVLLALGDQPFFSIEVAAQVVEVFSTGNYAIVAPSFARRRGHPIALSRPVMEAVLNLPADASPREAINRFADGTCYIERDDQPDGDLILVDVDTPEAYAAARQRAGLPPLDINSR